MNKKWLKYLQCPECFKRKLDYTRLGKDRGVIICVDCKQWYLELGGVLELVPEKINWEKKQQFRKLYCPSLKYPKNHPITKEIKQKLRQAKFFDKFFKKGREDYQESSFWKSEYALTLEPVKKNLKTKELLIDAGCGKGECSFILHKKGVKIIGFDISRNSILGAIQRTKRNRLQNEMFFFVGDVEHPPLSSNVADHYILFGVLLYIANPGISLQSASRVLKPKGKIFVHDNYASKLRWAFDLLMKLLPLWEEEVLDEPFFSKEKMAKLLKEASLKVSITTRVFLPPHFYNLFSDRMTKKILKITNQVFSRVPFIRNNGGIILIYGKSE